MPLTNSKDNKAPGVQHASTSPHPIDKPPKKSVYIFSDVHLSFPGDPTSPGIQQIETLFADFLSYLDRHSAGIEQVYILGDLFSYWIGDDENSYPSSPIFQQLCRLAEKIPVAFVHGNRDFLVGRKFSDQTGIAILPGYYRTTWYGHRLLLCHGDQLCIQDRAYQRMRMVFRSPWVQRLFLALPMATRRWVAQSLLRERTEGLLPDTTATDPPHPIPSPGANGHPKPFPFSPGAWQEQLAAQGMWSRWDVDWVIHGHIHTPMYLQSRAKGLLVLGDWRPDGAKIAKISASNGPELLHWPFPETSTHHAGGRATASNINAG